MTYHCPHCRRKITVDDSDCGRPHTCGHCGRAARVPDVSHRVRLAKLFEVQKRRPLVSEEWMEVAAHYRAIGSEDKADKAELSAARCATEEELAPGPDLAAEEAVAPPVRAAAAPRPAYAPSAAYAPRAAREPEAQRWVPLGLGVAALLVMAATRPNYAPALLTHLALCAALAAGCVLRGGDLALSGAGPLFLTPLLGGPLGLLATTSARTRVPRDSRAAGTWLAGVSIGLWLPLTALAWLLVARP
jgi:hypothetical protein